MSQPSGGRSGPDRWMVSYADLVTLLLAFFMTLYGASTVDSRKMEPVAQSIQEAFSFDPQGEERIGPAAPSASGARGTDAAASATREPSQPAAASRSASIEELHRRLTQEFAVAIDERRLEVIRDPRGVVVSFPDDATFPVGSSESTLAARQLIARVGETLLTVSNAIRIEGHTDDVPIRTAKYGSNWELSTARASAVVAFLITTIGVDPTRLSAAGYGEFHPRAANDSPANRARNRRVDLVILDGEDRQAAASLASSGGAQ